MRSATLYEKLPHGAVRCQACAHYCVVAKGRSGICGVRCNNGGELFLAVYGRPAAINVDPMEKKPLYHFLPGTMIFSLGTIGCNFACDFCQNWDISQRTRGKKQGTGGKSTDSLKEEWPPEKIVDYCVKNKIPAIAYTYNEPAIFAEYVYDTALLAKEKGIKNAMVSNGYFSKECLNYLAPVVDAVNIDLKSGEENFYSKFCGAKLSVVKENIKLWKEKGVWIELTTLIIPGRNDRAGQLEELADFIAGLDKDIPWHLSRFFPSYQFLDGEITPLETLLRAYKIGKNAGLKYVYIGNAPAGEYDNTFCPRCRELLIAREEMAVLENNLADGVCLACGQKIEGVWN